MMRRFAIISTKKLVSSLVGTKKKLFYTQGEIKKLFPNQEKINRLFRYIFLNPPPPPPPSISNGPPLRSLLCLMFVASIYLNYILHHIVTDSRIIQGITGYWSMLVLECHSKLSCTRVSICPIFSSRIIITSCYPAQCAGWKPSWLNKF